MIMITNVCVKPNEVHIPHMLVYVLGKVRERIVKLLLEKLTESSSGHSLSPFSQYLQFQYSFTHPIKIMYLSTHM